VDCVHRTAAVCLHRTAAVCVHRNPDGKYDIFLNKVELIIQILIVNNKISILDGDWNINFLHKSTNEREFNNFLLLYTANIPTGITKNTLMILDVMTINEKFEGTLSSYRFRIIRLLCGSAIYTISNFCNTLHRTERGQFREDNIKGFLY
jgi:hypothetical protein